MTLATHVPSDSDGRRHTPAARRRPARVPRRRLGPGHRGRTRLPLAALPLPARPGRRVLLRARQPRRHRVARQLLRALLQLRRAGDARARAPGAARAPPSSWSPASCSGACSAGTATRRRELAASTLTDRLTGLYNYGTFVDYLHNEVTKADRYGGELALLMLDLDHFKQFNDRHGHEAGNELLRRLGATLGDAGPGRGRRRALRRRGVRRAHPRRRVARLRAGRAPAPRRRGDRPSRSAAASGCARPSPPASPPYPAGAADEAELIEAADAALYECKRRGRNRVTIFTGVAGERELPASLTA